MNAAPQETETPVFTIEKIYLKDLSVEVPNAPHCFLERDPAQVNLQMQTQGEAIGEGIFDVTLTLTVTAQIGEKTQFLIEAAQAGIFQIRNVPTEELEPIVAVACPNILFPFARETVADAVTRAGFPPVLLQPVNFEAVYRERLAQREAEAMAQRGPHEVPIE
ncbi:MAG: protein-export chaperone SecB [Rhodocyclaceae bacterium]|nr:protein-export chaperone SecB [Rhodocyclaceae bacterium]